ncbi:MAG: hypothetical protein V4757_07235 [Pseudomonadota bacterium]
MTEPITSSDRCEVVDGLLGKNSPNIGLVVIARQYMGDHSRFGRMWRCETEHAVNGYLGMECDCPPGMQDFAQAWLRKLPPRERKAANDAHFEALQA